MRTRRTRTYITSFVVVALTLTACTTDDGEADHEAAAPASQEEQTQGETPEEPPLELRPLDQTGLANDVGDIALTSVDGGDDGWLVGGAAVEPGERPTSVLLTSPNGAVFTAEDLPAPDHTEHQVEIVRWVGDVAIAIGTAGSSGADQMVTWVGMPGSWTLADEGSVSAASLWFSDAIVVGDELLVVGAERAEDGTWSPAAWNVDAEGRISQASEGLAEAEGTLRGVATDGEQILAAGRIGPSAAYVPIGVFRSDDGTTWEQLDTSGLDEGFVRSLTVRRGRFELVGSRVGSGSGEAEVWTSPNGLTWRAEGLPYDYSTSLAAVYKLDGSRFGIGDHLYPTAETSERVWSDTTSPLGGHDGTFGDSAEHDGQVLAVWTRDGGLSQLLLTDDGSGWLSVTVAEDLLDRTEGRYGTWLHDVETDGTELVVAGSRTDLEGREPLRRSLLTTAPGFEPAPGAADFDGWYVGLLHVDGGWLTVGTIRTDGADYHGVRLATSEDGTSWTSAERVSSGRWDRASGVDLVGDRPVVTGLTWREGQLVSLLWEIDGEEASPMDVRGLDGWGATRSCGRGDILLLSLHDGGRRRALGISTDAGATFSIVDDGPMEGASGLSCDVDDAGQALLVIYGRTSPEVHRFDPVAGTFTAVDSGLRPRSSFGNVRWDPTAGWLLTGSERIDEDTQRGVVLMEQDGELAVLGLASDAEVTHGEAALVVGDQLQVLGRADGELRRWGLPIEELGLEEPAAS